MPGIDYRAARAAIRIREVLELLSFAPTRRRGDELRGPCPLHGSRSPTSRSFAVNLAQDAYHCFVCGAAGNQLDLWAAAQRQPLFTATCELCRRLGKDIPWLPDRGPTLRVGLETKPPRTPDSGASGHDRRRPMRPG
jgi:DNA primase